MWIKSLYYSFRALDFISFIKTVGFNLKYFGIKKGLLLPVYISKNVVFNKRLGKIVLADYTTGIVKIGFGNIGIFDSKYDRTVIEFCDKSKIEFRGSASVGHGSKISVQSNGELILGKNFCITANSTIICTKKIIFGTDCLLSWDILIMDSDLHQISDNLNSVLNSPNPVIIGNHVWIGAKTTILKGTEISEGCVVGANSLVSNVFKELNTLIAGVPSEVIKSNISWKR